MLKLGFGLGYKVLDFGNPDSCNKLMCVLVQNADGAATPAAEIFKNAEHRVIWGILLACHNGGAFWTPWTVDNPQIAFFVFEEFLCLTKKETCCNKAFQSFGLLNCTSGVFSLFLAFGLFA